MQLIFSFILSFFLISWSLSYFLVVEFSSLFPLYPLGTMGKGGGGLEAVTLERNY